MVRFGMSIALLLLTTSADLGGQQLPATLRSGNDTVHVLAAQRHDALHGGVLKPSDPSTAFLVVSFLSSDAALDAERSSLATVASACGSVVTGGKTIESDGGGLMEGRSVCNYVVPKTAKSVELRLLRYPALTLPIAESRP